MSTWVEKMIEEYSEAEIELKAYRESLVDEGKVLKGKIWGEDGKEVTEKVL